MKAPPWLERAKRAARLKGPGQVKAQREAQRWDRMRSYARAVVRALEGCEVEETTVQAKRVQVGGRWKLVPDLTDTGLQRIAVAQVRMGDGQRLVTPDARALREDWLADPVRARESVSACAETWALRPHRDGAWRAGPVSCGCGLCPLCVTMGIAAKRDEWSFVLEYLVRLGYHLVLLTRTRPADVAPASPLPVVWTEHDRARWGDCPFTTAEQASPEDRIGCACPGETLGAAWDDLAGSWRRVLDSRKKVLMPDGGFAPRREWWARTVVCQVDAMEATQVLTDEDGHATGLRWHVHGHSLVVLDPSALDVDRDTYRDDSGRTVLRSNGPWMRRYLTAWASESDGARESAQHAALVSAPGNDIRAAIRETVKYAGKLSEMTDAGVIEWLATTKGRHPHREGGTLHGGTTRGRVARLGRLIDELRDLEAIGDGKAADKIREELHEAIDGCGFGRLSAKHCESYSPAKLAELKAELEAELREMHASPEAAHKAKRDELDDWERQHADDVHAACVAWDRAERREDDLHGWQGDVYQPARPELGEDPAEGRLHMLTWERLGLLLAAGLRVADDLRLIRGVDDTEDLGRVDLRAVRRAVRSWEAQSRERGD